MKRLKLDQQSAAEIRLLAEAVDSVLPRLDTQSQSLLESYREVSGQLGVHRDSFNQLMVSVKKSENMAKNALVPFPKLLVNVAEKIEDYIRNKVDPDALVFEEKGVEVAERNRIARFSNNSRRTVSEIWSLLNDLELTDGDPDIPQIGGIYKDICVDGTIYERHHIPPQSVFSESSQSLPVIVMLKKDHKYTTSHSGKMGSHYRSLFPNQPSFAKHKELVCNLVQTQLYEEIRNEIYEIRNSFGSKYDGAIKEYLVSVQKLLRETEN